MNAPNSSMRMHSMVSGVMHALYTSPNTSTDIASGRLVRQSLSSRTAETIQRFQQTFSELKEKFMSAVSIQTLKVVFENHQVLRDDLTNIRGALDAWADQGNGSIHECASVVTTSFAQS